MEDAEANAHIERAKRAYNAALLLAREGLVEDAYSRAYYAIAHLAYALLLSVNETLPKTHSGLVAKLWNIREKLKLNADVVKTISRFQALRENGDYSPIPALTEKDLNEILDVVRKVFSIVGVRAA